MELLDALLAVTTAGLLVAVRDADLGPVTVPVAAVPFRIGDEEV
jgi:hypothetical protein